MRSDAAEDVGEIRDWFDPVRLAGCRERVEPRDVVAGLFVADKEKILSAESDHSERGLASIVVRRNLGVIEEAGQLLPAIEGVSARAALSKTSRS